MAGTPSKAGPSTAPSQQAIVPILSGEKVFLGQDQFDEFSSGILLSYAESLGAASVPERKDATILLVNPLSTAYPKEEENERFLDRNYPTLPRPTLLPYHWMAACRSASSKLDLADLDPKIPFLVHPAKGKDSAPLKVWVSKNIERHDSETPDEALLNVTLQLEKAGAITVSKRAHADVLIVDTSSKFYQTVKAEKEKHGRTWQKLAQRDWVDFCIANKTLQWRTEQEGEAEGGTGEDPGQDSFGEEDPVRSAAEGKGPGRPTGKPRVDYSPQDDDFLCRYLAAHHPSGSWQSRKTYQLLTDNAARYPIADRHSSQSWHERFKKNTTSFTGRIRRFMAAGIDRSLKTAQEREETEARRREEEEQMAEAEAAATGIAAVADPGQAAASEAGFAAGAEAGPSHSHSSGDNQTAISNEPLSASKKRKLVELDSDDEGFAGTETNDDKAGQSLSNAAQSIVLESLAHVQEGSACLGASDSLPLTQALDDPGPATFGPAQNINAEPTHLEALPESTQSNGQPASLDGPETQAVLADFAAIQAGTQVVAADAPKSPARRTVRMDEATIAQTSPRQSTHSPRINTVRPIMSPVRPAHELIGLQSTPGAASTATLPASVLIGMQQSHHTPAPAAAERFTTPTSASARHRTPLRDELERSASKRRRTLDPASGSRSRKHHQQQHTPDMVYASVSLPPAIPKPAPLATESATERPTPPAQVHQTTEEWVEKVQKGKSVSTSAATAYRARIQSLCERYRIQPAELLSLMADLQTDEHGGRRKVGWDALEGVLVARLES